MPLAPNIDTDTPGWEIFSAICADSYNDVSHPEINTDMFKRIYDSSAPEKIGYHGALYATGVHLDGSIEAVIVHRGTSNIPNIFEDIELFLNICLSQIPDARKFSQECIDLLYARFRQPNESREEFVSRNKIWHTGHSIGAALSDIVSCLDFKTGSCTIDNPGSADILATYFNIYGVPYDHGGFVTLQTLPNFINTARAQMGDVYQLINRPYSFDFITAQLILQPMSISWNVFANLWWVPFTIYNHKIVPVYEALQNFDNFPIIAKIDYFPTGLQNGYHFLLDTERFRNFWNNFFQKIWQVNHHGKEERAFIEEGIKHLENIRSVINPAVRDKKKSSYQPLGFFSRSESGFVVIENTNIKSDEHVNEETRKCIMQ